MFTRLVLCSFTTFITYEFFLICLFLFFANWSIFTPYNLFLVKSKNNNYAKEDVDLSHDLLVWRIISCFFSVGVPLRIFFSFFVLICQGAFPLNVIRVLILNLPHFRRTVNSLLDPCPKVSS